MLGMIESFVILVEIWKLTSFGVAAVSKSMFHDDVYNFTVEYSTVKYYICPSG